MKNLSLLIIVFISTLHLNSQEHTNNKYAFSTTKLSSYMTFSSDVYEQNYKIEVDTNPLLIYDLKYPSLEFNSEALNTKLFSNISIVENTYYDYAQNLRGCKPLENGITNTVNSKEVLMSSIFDNFLNNYLFEGKGIFFRN